MFAKWIDADSRFAFSVENNGGVEISTSKYNDLIQKQTMGMQIIKDANGLPVASPPNAPSLADTKATKQREISTSADSFLASMAQEYGAYEKLTWDQQSLESDALLSDPDAPAPLVRAIASARGMTALEMAGRIAANRAQWVALSGAVVGKRLAYQDALDAAQTVEEVAAIVPVFP